MSWEGRLDDDSDCERPSAGAHPCGQPSLTGEAWGAVKFASFERWDARPGPGHSLSGIAT